MFFFLSHIVSNNMLTVDPPTPSELASDLDNLTQSVKSLLSLILTSASFRLILSSLFSTTREFIASTASSVGNVAGWVEVEAREVEKAAKRGDVRLEETKEKMGDAWARLENIGGGTGNDNFDKLKDEFVDRVQETIIRAHKNPQYRSALRTMIKIIRKYTTKFSLTASSIPQGSPITIESTIDLDRHVARALLDLKILLERCASGTSLDPFLAALKSFVIHVSTTPNDTSTTTDIGKFFSDLGRWLDASLSRLEYVTSQEGISSLGNLYTRARTLLTDTSTPWAQDVRQLSSLADSFIIALSHDRALTRFTNALDAFSIHARNLRRDALTASARTHQKWREELWRDLAGWVIPRVLRMLRSVPMPRVEYMDANIDLALDSLLLTSSKTGVGASASLAPDHILLQNWSEVRLDMADGANSRALTSTRMRLHVDGLRVSARGVGYYLRYKGLVGYSDEGIGSLDVGRREKVGDGLSLDIEVETDTALRDNTSNDFDQLFTVSSVNATIPGLAVSLDKSHHSILNKLFIQPLAAGLVGRTVLGRVVEGQVKKGIEALEMVLRDVVRGAEKKVEERTMEGDETVTEGPEWGDYWEALLDGVTLTGDVTEEEGEEPPLVESNTTATLKGIVHTTTTQQHPSASSPPTPSETVLAVGAGAQLFPNKGVPHSPSLSPSAAAANIAREVVDEAEEAIEAVGDVVGGMVEGAVDDAARMRDDVNDAEVRFGARERVEKKRNGWRSSVFNL